MTHLRSIALGFTLILSACRKPLPEGLDRAFLSELLGYADTHARLCDEMLKHPCYSGPGLDHSGDSLPKFPGAGPLEKDRRVRDFGAHCRPQDPTPEGWPSCYTADMTKLPAESDKCRMDEFTGWPPAKMDVEGDYIVVPRPGTCVYPWIDVRSVRKTSGRNLLVAYFNLLPLPYVDANAEALGERKPGSGPN